MTFSLLPTELIELCFSFIDPDDKATCVALCATNRLGRRVGTPILYHAIGNHYDMTRSSNTNGLKQLQLLCRTLLERNDLARLAEGARFHLHHVTEIPDRDVFFRDDDLMWEILEKKSIPSEIWPGVSRSESDTTATAEDYIDLALLLCPALKTIEFCGTLSALRAMHKLHFTLVTINGTDTNSLGVNDPLRSCEISYFSIQEVSLRKIYAPREYATHADIWPLLKLPSLRTLSTESLVESPLGPTVGDLGRTSSIQQLIIENCQAGLAYLDQLLIPCNNLQSLSIQWLLKEDAHFPEDWVDLGETLQLSCPSLKQLRLEYAVDEGTEFEDDGDGDDDFCCEQGVPGMYGMKRLQSLTHLTITKNALLGMKGPIDVDEYPNLNQIEDGQILTLPTLEEVLPDSLQQLTVICYGDSLRPEAKELFNDPRAERLCDLVVMNSRKDRWYDKSSWQRGTGPERRLSKSETLSALADQVYEASLKVIEEGLIARECAIAFRTKLEIVANTHRKRLKEYCWTNDLPPPTAQEVETCIERMLMRIMRDIGDRRPRDIKRLAKALQEDA